MPLRRVAYGLSVVALAGLIGCGGGGGSGEADELQATANGFFKATEKGDGATVCRRYLARNLRQSPGPPCVKIWSIRNPHSQQTSKVSDVSVMGDTATATIGGVPNYKFKKEGGKWRIADIPSPYSTVP